LPKLLFLADVCGPSSRHVGDEAMLEANISLLRRLLPDCEIEVAAGRGWDGTRLGARAVPRMEFSPDSEAERDALLQASRAALDSVYPAARAALSCDTLIISGGGNLCHTWPHHIYERLAMARLASSRGAPVMILGQTLGPELGVRERQLLTELLQLSAWTGLRETYSYSLALELGADPETLSYQLDDATFLAPEPAQTDGFLPSSRPWIAVTIHPVVEPSIGNPVIERLASSLRTIAETTEAELVFLPHVDFPRASGALSDGAFGEAIARSLDANPPLRIHPVLPAARTLWLTQQASLVISTRYHPLVFAMAGSVPAVGLWTDEYTRRKLLGALIHAARPGDAMSLEEALAGGLTAKALQLWHSRAWFREELQSRVSTWRGDEEVRFAKLGCRLRAGMAQRRIHLSSMSRIQEILRGTSLANPHAEGLAIFTICSNNYVSMAGVLLASAKRFHPEATLYLCLADGLLPNEGFYPAGCVVVPIEDLDIPDLRSFVFRYDIMELNTAVKPFMFQRLLRMGHEIILYFDPDIQIFSRLKQILEPLQDDASLVLTPHLCAPAEGDAFPDDVTIMRAGIYNLGFLGVHAGPESESILAWWARRLQYQCVNDQEAGIFVDQKFIDLVPGFADQARILRDPTVNVAYWNLQQRTLSFEDDIWKVDGRPLGFYHFSGFDPVQMDRLSKHTDAFRGNAISQTLVRLLEQYAAKLRANHHGRIPAALYAYGRFASGTPIPPIVRKMFRDRHLIWAADPFATYESYLHAPMPGLWAGSSSAIVTNLMGYLHEQEPYLRHTFDLSQPSGVRGFVDWFIRHGEPWVEDGRLIEPVAERAGRQLDSQPRSPPAPRLADETDINVVGYLRSALGLGEAGRLNLRSLTYGGLRARGLETSLNSLSQRSDRSCDHLIEPEAKGRFQLFSIGVDQLEQVIEHLRPVLRPDAYRIVAPFWELSNLPDAWLPAIDAMDEIWAPTRFIQMIIAKKVRKPVLRMPLMLDFAKPAPVEREQFGLPPFGFMFFFAFDYLSFLERKNPMAVVNAFKCAFRANGDARTVHLVLKTMNAEVVPESGRAMREMLQDDPDITLIEKTLTREETLALIGACDAVVTLHRSEGLGLLVAEAMVLGKPVIATDYSGTTELVTPDTGWPVDYSLTPVLEGMYPFHEGQVWADPDIDHAAWQMRRVLEDQPEVERRVKAARALISREYGIEAVAARQLARLRSIEGK
jgi:polysaccharide pyruvyl transferase WcaK-like protein/glycosyltransferase involved in cell wall biosynthesis